MRELSSRELELLVGGYQDYSAAEALTDTDIGSMAQQAQGMSDAQASTYATQQAQAFGIDVGGGVTITPIFNPFSGPNDIRYGVRASARC